MITVLDSATESVPAGVSFGQRYASIYGGIRVQCAMWLVAVVENAQTLVSDRDLAAAGSASCPALHVWHVAVKALLQSSINSLLGLSTRHYSAH